MIAQILDTDYAGVGVILIILWCIFKDSKHQYLPAVIYSVFLYGVFFLTLGFVNYGFNTIVIFEAIFSTCGALLSIPILKMYNGERGKLIKWFFYTFYPLHISLIVIAYYFTH